MGKVNIKISGTTADPARFSESLVLEERNGGSSQVLNYQEPIG